MAARCVAVTLVLLSAACTAAVRSPTARYADGLPKRAQLSPLALRVREAALKPEHLCERRAARIARVSTALPPDELSDMIDSIPTGRSARRKRAVAAELVRAFAEAGQVARTSTFSSLIAACRRQGELGRCERLVETLHGAGLRVNPKQYASLIGDLASAGDVAGALRLERSAAAAGVAPTNETHAVLISSLLASGHVAPAAEIARRLRDEAGAYDLPLYNTMLQALLACGVDGEARSLLGAIRAAGLRPTERTISVLLKGFVQHDELGAALEVCEPSPAATRVPRPYERPPHLAGLQRVRLCWRRPLLASNVQHPAARLRAAGRAAQLRGALRAAAADQG